LLGDGRKKTTQNHFSKPFSMSSEDDRSSDVALAHWRALSPATHRLIAQRLASNLSLLSPSSYELFEGSPNVPLNQSISSVTDRSGNDRLAAVASHFAHMLRSMFGAPGDNSAPSMLRRSSITEYSEDCKLIVPFVTLNSYSMVVFVLI
jgi:hypothetical protein